MRRDVLVGLMTHVMSSRLITADTVDCANTTRLCGSISVSVTVTSMLFHTPGYVTTSGCTPRMTGQSSSLVTTTSKLILPTTPSGSVATTVTRTHRSSTPSAKTGDPAVSVNVFAPPPPRMRKLSQGRLDSPSATAASQGNSSGSSVSIETVSVLDRASRSEMVKRTLVSET